MRFAVIGGYERGGAVLAQVAAELGHESVSHSGHTSGRGADEIRRLVAWADVVVVVTDVNSHGAVKIARIEARRLGRPVELTRRLGTQNLRALIARAA